MRLLPTNLPQTLQVGVYLLYWNALLGLLFGAFAGGGGGVGFALFLLLVVAEAAGGLGVANQRKWGYVVALGAAVLPFVLIFLGGGASILTLIFEIALLVALLHPMSRSYVKLWFR